MAEQFTEKDVTLVASWLHAEYCSAPECGPSGEEEELARKILRVLAETGRLLPNGFTFHTTDSGDLVFYEVRTAQKFLLMSSTWNRVWLTDPKDNTDD